MSLRSTAALALAAGSLAAATLTATTVPTAHAAAAALPGYVAKVTDGCIQSVPEPGTTDPVDICYTLFQPAGSSRTNKVPLLMHSHGWGGSRTTDPASFQKFLQAGYGVLSFDQRGFGESGGYAHVENPAYEGQDNLKLINLVAHLPWVQKDGPGDPRLGAIGGSYGGGYQLLGAFMEIEKRGTPVYDALAPEITWYDLKESLGPQEVVRTTWASALSAAALPSDALPHNIYVALAEGAATGTWPDGSNGTENLTAFFEKNGPKYHVQHGERLNIPVLFGQGTTDTLFELRQGFRNFQNTLTDKARARSIFIGYNGGHVLPKVFPQGVSVSSDPCSKELGGGSFSDLSLKFFDQVLKGKNRGLTGFGQYHIATPDSTCTTVSSVAANTELPIGTVATTEAGGAAIPYAVAQGPIRIAGAPYLTGDLTALGADNRAFYGLAVGTSPADAHVVQDNMLPIRETAPVLGEPRTIDLPAVAIDVPAGQTLYVMASPIDDIFVGMGSRTPGAVVLDNTVVHLPVVH